MNKTAHYIYIAVLTLVVLASLLSLIYIGSPYYIVELEERYFHPDHQDLKPSGFVGHGLGVVGSLLIIIGVASYMIRKRRRSMYKYGKLKHWLEFHIFLCTLGPILILFHTAFKFGGLVAISFWSMVAVFLSGIIGRFIYIQIPRSIEGRELSLSEVRGMRSEIEQLIVEEHQLDESTRNRIREVMGDRAAPAGSFSLWRGLRNYVSDLRKISNIRMVLKAEGLSTSEQRKIITLVKKDISLNRKIRRLNVMQNLFKYWHVAHLPFAFVMLVIMIIHVVVTIRFGYKWIF